MIESKTPRADALRAMREAEFDKPRRSAKPLPGAIKPGMVVAGKDFDATIVKPAPKKRAHGQRSVKPKKRK